MSLDIYLTAVRPTTVFSRNITHNLAPMASAAGIYKHMWRPEEVGATCAGDLIAPLRAGLDMLNAEPDRFKALNPENGWGSYERLLDYVTELLGACQENPDAKIEVSR